MVAFMSEVNMIASNTSLKRVRVFVSSPGDVRAERKITEEVLSFLQAEFSSYLCIDPLFWENEVQFAHNDFQGNIEPPSQSDLFICILWSRLGTRLHPRKYTRADGSPYLSGTEFEFEDAIEAFKKTRCPHLMLFKNETEVRIPENPPNEYTERTAQRHALQAFFENWTKDQEFNDVYSAGFNIYVNLEEFKAKLTKYLRQFFQGLLPTELDIHKHLAWKGSPFRGLEYFDFEHAPIFKGRTAVTGEIFIRLKQQFKNKKPFLLLGGSSGVGKSSLIRAGLLRLLLNESQEWNTAAWRYAELRPSDIRKEDGEKDFADVLSRALTQQRQAPLAIVDGAQTLRTPPSALPQLLEKYQDMAHLGQCIRQDIHRVVADIKECLSDLAMSYYEEKNAHSFTEKPQVRLCLLLDQMEEFFTTSCSTPENINSFFKALRVLVEERALVVISTIRADYLSFCEDVPDLQFLKDGNSYYHLSPPSQLDMGSIINEPAQAAGILFERREDTSLNEVIRTEALSYDSLGQKTTVLPLLEFTLTELYEKAKNTQQEGPLRLTFAHYDELGGLQGAIATKADVTFKAFQQEFPVHFTQIFAHVMRCLVVGTQEGLFSRQKALQEKIDAIAGGKQFMDAFIRARLFTVDTDEMGRVTVSIVHEALLQHWQYLRLWLEQEREYFAMLQRVQSACVLWKQEKEPKDLLLSEGKSLRDAEYLRLEHASALSDEEVRFIAASKKHAERQKRRLHMLIVALIIGFALAIIMFFQAREQEQKAIAARNEAITSRNNAENLIEYMLYDLRDQLEPLGKLPILAKLHDKVDEYYKNSKSSESIPAKRRQGTMLSQQANTLFSRGNINGALELYLQSLDIRRLVSASNPNNTLWQQDLIITLRRVGDILALKGEFEKAYSFLQESLDISRLLVKQHPEKDSYATYVIDTLASFAATHGRAGKNEDALSIYQEIITLEKTLIAAHKHNEEYKYSLALNISHMGDIFANMKDYEKAIAQYKESIKMLRGITLREGLNFSYKSMLGIVLVKLGYNLALMDKKDEAFPLYMENLKISLETIKIDTTNALWLTDFRNAMINMQMFIINHKKVLQSDVDKVLALLKECSEVSSAYWLAAPQSTTWKDIYDLANDIYIYITKAKDNRQENMRMLQKKIMELPISPESSKDIPHKKWDNTTFILDTISARIQSEILTSSDGYKTLNENDLALEKNSNNLLTEGALDDSSLELSSKITDLYVERMELLLKKGVHLKARSQPTKALSALEECAAVSRTLLKNDTNNKEYRKHLLLALINSGDVLRAIHKDNKGFTLYQEGFEVARALVRENEACIECKEKVSMFLIKMGEVHFDKKEFAKVQPLYAQSLAIAKELVVSAPENQELLWNLTTIAYKNALYLRTMARTLARERAQEMQRVFEQAPQENNEDLLDVVAHKIFAGSNEKELKSVAKMHMDLALKSINSLVSLEPEHTYYKQAQTALRSNMTFYR